MLGLLIIGGLLGTLVLGDIFGDDDTPPPENEDVSPTPEGIDLLLTSDSETTLTGTEGDDTLTSEDPPTSEGPPIYTTTTDEVYLGGGDDVATVGLYGVSVYGGDGEDTLTSTIGGELYGEAGDDVLEIMGSGGSAAHGGEGNDTITIVARGGVAMGGEGNDMLIANSDYLTPSGATYMRGDAGDDELVISRQVGLQSDYVHSSGVVMTGGEGQDIFRLDLELVNAWRFGGDIGGNVGNTVGDIVDFDPTEDSLVIDVDRGTDAEDREMTSATLENVSATYNGVEYNTTTLVMVFGGNENSGSATVRLGLGDMPDLTMDDLVINLT